MSTQELFEQFRRHVLNHHADIAIRDSLESPGYTFAQTDELSSRVHGWLKGHGIGKEDFVLIFLPRGKDIPVSEIGVWKAGAAFVVCEEGMPAERVEFIRKDCNCRITIDRAAWTEILSTQPYDECKETSAHDAAYAVYTSGTTGNPKGVLHEYGNLEQAWMCLHRYGNEESPFFSDNDITAILSPLNFVASVMYTVLFLRYGCMLSIVPYDVVKSPSGILEYFTKGKVTSSAFTPSLLRLVPVFNPELNRIQISSESGEGISISGPRLYNVYAMSETGFLACMHRIEESDTITTIGRPQFPLKTWVLDDDENEVGTGEVGEFCFENEYVRGYINQPELTAKAWTNGIFHSGDLAYRTPDGDIVIMGRKDDMIKIAGNRVEPSEVEAAIRNVLGIDWCAVKPFDSEGGKLLCAYYKDDIAFDYDDVREKLSGTIPSYMIPAAFIHIDEIPLNSNNKLDRNALPKPDFKALSVDAPSTDMELKLTDAVSQVLNVKSFGVTTNLVSIGLSSIGAMKLSTILDKNGISISVADIMRQPTIREMANKCTGKHIHIPHTGLNCCHLTESQRGIFLDWEMNHNTTQYNIPSVHRFSDTDPDRLAYAVSRVIDAHPYLKTGLEMREGEPMQILRDEDLPAVTVTKLNSEPDIAFFQAKVRPFDLFHDRLYRFEIYVYRNEVWLFIDIHHIVTDGLSMCIITNGITEALHGGEPVQESVTSFDFSEYESTLSGTDAYAEAQKWFNTLLDYAQAAIYPTSESPDRTGTGRVHSSVSMKTVEGFCSRCSVTVSSFLHAVLAETLHRITRDEHPMFATVSNGRSVSVELENTIGMFVRTLPVVLTDERKSGSTVDFVKAIHSQLQESYSHEFYPYTRIVEDSGKKASVQFAYQGKLYSSMGIIAGSEAYPLESDTAKFPILVTAYDWNDDIIISVEYDGMLYSRSDMQAFANAMAAAALSFTVSIGLNDVQIVSHEQKESIVRLSCGERLEYDRTMTFVDMFLEQVKKTPEHVAVADGNRQLTFKELDTRSNAVAHRLLDSGVKPDEFVAVMLDRTVNFPVAVIGVFKAGAAYVPIDLEYPENRVNFILENCETKLVIDEEWMKGTGTSTAAVNLSQPLGRAYMTYTSGSTGLPKGAVLKHAGLVNFIHAVIRVEQLTDSDRISGYSSFSFDAHIRDMYPILTIGGQYHIMPESIRKDLYLIRDFILSHRITGGGYTTSIAALLLNTFKDLPVRFITAGGEKLQNVSSDHIRIINAYGPTEFTDDASFYPIEPGTETDNIPIGRPVPNNAIFICDQYGNLLPQGMSGELYLAGNQVAEGYWKRDELTAEKFKACPFLPDGQRMYRSGDMGKWNEDGLLEIQGRMDSQVKIRGFRIELGEIESCALKFPGLAQTAACVRTINAEPQIVLYIVPSDNKSDETALREHLSRNLAEYMLPSYIVTLDRMPRLSNGKVDRKALPTPETSAKEIVFPANETERKICGIVCDMLGTDNISVTTNLISAGLSSIGAMQLTAMLDKAGFSLRVADVMKHPTVRELAVTADGQSGVSVRIPQTDQDYYPLTENQRGVYLDWEMNRDTTQYNVPILYKFTDVKAETLSNALKKVANVHPYLKVRLEMRDKEPVQVRRDNAQTVVRVTELETAPDKAFFQSRVRPFDLFGEELYRFEIYSYGNDTWLFQDIHHIIKDGITASIIASNITGVLNGKEPAPETITYFDFAAYEHSLKETGMYADAEKWFDALMENAQPAVYPVSQKPDGVRTGLVHGSMSKDTVTGFCSQCGVTVGSFLQAVLAETLRRITREEHPMFATVSNGRSASDELSNTVGMFVKTLPMVLTHTVKTGSTVDFVKAVHTQLQESYSREFYPYTRIVERHGVKAAVLFAYQDGIYSDSGNSIADAETCQMEPDTVKFPITIMAYPDKDSIIFHLEYDGMQYSKSDMQTFADALVCAAISFTSANTLDDVRMMPREKELTELGTGEKLDYDRNQTIIGLFRQQVRRTPDNIAVSFHGRDLTYREVDELTDSLAVHLHEKHGVGTETVVGVRIRRCELMVLYPLAIMKAGGAYLPLDVDFPEERISFICSDAGVLTVLSDEVFPDLPKATEEQLKALPVAQPHNAFVILYTSGSTGEPKGVILEHRSIVNFCHWYVKEFSLTEHDRTVAFANFGFDAHMMDIFPALCCGASVHIVPSDIRLDIDALGRFFTEEKITVAYLPTQIGTLFASSQHPSSLRVLHVGGESLKPMKKPGYRFFNGYGPTECTIYASLYEIAKDHESKLGRPLANVNLFVVDDSLNPVPEGIPGELLIAGDCVGRGYLNSPELTARKFITFGGQRAYRTGDLCRWDEDGNLEFLGRMDTQVKIRGFRIELGEIESCAMKADGIAEAVAAVQEMNGNLRIILYAVPKEGIWNEEALRKHLSEHLADYMLPSHIVRLDSLPLTANGKIDRKALPELDKQSLVQYVAPENETESTVCRVFSEVLSLPQVGACDRFNEIGGNSIQAIITCLKLRKELAMADSQLFSPNDVLRLQTPQRIAEFCMERKPLCRLHFLLFAEKDRIFKMENLNKVLKTREVTVPPSGTVAPTIMNLALLPYRSYSTPHKMAVSKAVPLALALEQFSKIAYGSVLEYAFNGKEYVVYPGARKDIDILDISETEADGILQKLYTVESIYDGKSLLSEVFAISPESSDCHWIYFNIHHSIFDFASSDVLVHNMNRLLRGKEMISDIAPKEKGNAGKINPELMDEFKAAVATITGILDGHDYESRVFSQNDGESDTDNPIRTIMEMFLSENPLLDKVDTIPLFVTNHGRNMETYNQMGKFAISSAELYDRRTGTFRTVGSIADMDIRVIADPSQFITVPTVNYQGYFEEKRSREHLLVVLKGPRAITASRIGNEILVGLPIYK